ncbi:MAG: hypothetical protein K1Y02_07395 [Candidatus Hydrogenedentes bacterium]|nr:hypothetical protein [Candidatus Hydrogenedentota bacterium]
MTSPVSGDGPTRADRAARPQFLTRIEAILSHNLKPGQRGRKRKPPDSGKKGDNS